MSFFGANHFALAVLIVPKELDLGFGGILSLSFFGANHFLWHFLLSIHHYGNFIRGGFGRIMFSGPPKLRKIALALAGTAEGGVDFTQVVLKVVKKVGHVERKEGLMENIWASVKVESATGVGWEWWNMK